MNHVTEKQNAFCKSMKRQFKKVIISSTMNQKRHAKFSMQTRFVESWEIRKNNFSQLAFLENG